jgi:inositol polyphosphate 5-phosphatase INPP5J/K
VEKSIDCVKELLSRSQFTKLLEYDQLNIILKQNEPLFKNVKEMNILFPPTYKFDLNTNNYDTSAKKRLFYM